MSQGKHEVMVFLGTLATGWWSQLDPAKKALAALGIVAIVAFSIGAAANQLILERGNVMVRLDRVERIAVRDSTRVEALAAAQAELDAETEERVGALESRLSDIELTLDRVDERTQRIVCMLSGNRGPSCL